MMAESLFPLPPLKREHRAQRTSVEAFRALVGVSDKQQAVYRCLYANGPMTDKEIAAALGWAINRVTPRRGELVLKGYVRKTADRREGGILWAIV